MSKSKPFSRRRFSLRHNSGRRIRRFKNHPFVIPIVTFLVLFGVTSVGLVAFSSKTALPTDAHIVKLTVEGEEQTVPTRVATVGELLERLDITLGKNDVVEPAVETKIQEDNFRVNVYRARPITVIDGDKKVYSASAASTPRTIAKQAGVTVYPEDEAATEPIDNILRDGLGERVVITRAFPVTLNLYGVAVPTRTLAKTVGEFIDEKKIKLENGETLQPQADQPISPDSQIFVLRAGTQLQVAEEEIPVPVQVIQDKSLSYGTTAVRQNGSPGKKVVTYALVGATGERQKVQEVIVQNPVPQIIARGSVVDISNDKTGLMRTAGISEGEFGAVNYIISRESNWRPNARNASGCLGLGQRCPGSVLVNACPNWEYDPVCQLRHFSAYAANRNFAPYGKGWNAAYQYWLDHGHW